MPAELEVRGEVYLPRSRFEAMNREREEAEEEPFANPRNAAAGTMKSLDAKLAASRGLDIYLYAVAHVKGVALHSQWEALERMRSWGLKTNPASRRCAGPRRGPGLLRGVAGEARRPRVRDRRRGGEGRRLRPPAGAGLHRRSSRAGPSPTSTRPARRPRSSGRSKPTWAGRASSRRWPTSIPSSWPAPRSAGPPSTTRRRSRARTCA